MPNKPICKHFDTVLSFKTSSEFINQWCISRDLNKGVCTALPWQELSSPFGIIFMLSTATSCFVYSQCNFVLKHTHTFQIIFLYSYFKDASINDNTEKSLIAKMRCTSEMWLLFRSSTSIKTALNISHGKTQTPAGDHFSPPRIFNHWLESCSISAEKYEKEIPRRSCCWNLCANMILSDSDSIGTLGA